MPTDNAEPVPGRGWARARWWASALALAALVGLLDWLRARVSLPASARLPYLPWTVVSWMLWVPVVAALSLSVRRLVASGASRSVLVAGLLGGFVLVMLYMSVGSSLLSRVSGPASWQKVALGNVFLMALREFVHTGIVYLGLVGLLFTVEYGRRLRRESLEAARLEAQLTRAQLDAMRVQLQPQLIEDTLQTTASLVRSGASTQAVQLLARLSDVLRMTLATLGQEKVSLAQELEFLEGYIALQQIRAPGRLRSRIDVAPEALTAEVPSLALFQLAELPSTPWEGALELSATAAEGRLRVRMRQLAPARSGSEMAEAGDRLERLRDRLRHLYPEAHQLRVDRENAGLLCTLELPLVHVEAPEFFASGPRAAVR